jgi:co-chaperonin GroES (HSP10)
MSLMDYRISAKTNPKLAEKEETSPKKMDKAEILKQKWKEYELAFDTQQELMEKEIGCSFPIQGHILLLKAVVLPEKTGGGIYLAQETRDQARYDIGLVIGIGPEAYRDPEMFPNGPRCKVGDWIDFKPYEKSPKNYNDHPCFIVQDDRVNYPIPNLITAVKELRSQAPLKESDDMTKALQCRKDES